ncbi:hypothetical protein CLV78_107120 [Aliiruegeria haliotis]|uniref:Uncharacterized protein n=1 Tax=Aliiruegeria haliotis TaxID=1280846 RepID=A0A2T0RLX4_9RHOB|nr:hypothetical protein CLV78_107120 [Aliiruegeria haliotis]
MKFRGESGNRILIITARRRISSRALKYPNGSRFVIPGHAPAPGTGSNRVLPPAPSTTAEPETMSVSGTRREDVGRKAVHGNRAATPSGLARSNPPSGFDDVNRQARPHGLRKPRPLFPESAVRPVTLSGSPGNHATQHGKGDAVGHDDRRPAGIAQQIRIAALDLLQPLSVGRSKQKGNAIALFQVPVSVFLRDIVEGSPLPRTDVDLS